jgi:hypothetical protein
MTEPDRYVSTYRTYLLAALHLDLRAVRLGHGHRGGLFGRTRFEIRRVLHRAQRRDWRAIRRTLGGWRAEHAYAGTRCGTGWTRRRALADLRRHLDQIGAQR